MGLIWIITTSRLSRHKMYIVDAPFLAATDPGSGGFGVGKDGMLSALPHEYGMPCLFPSRGTYLILTFPTQPS